MLKGEMLLEEVTRWGIARRTLAVVFAILVVLFAATTLAGQWYKAERIRRAREYFELAGRLEKSGRHAAAVEEYRNALGIAPGNPSYRLALARALIRLHRDDEAALYLQEVLRAHPSNAVPDLELARIAVRQGRDEAAADYYQRAIYGQWPDHAAQNRLEARWELVSLLQRGAKGRELAAQLLEISAEARDDLAARKRAGAMLAALGAADQAAEVYRDLLRDAPRDAEAETGLGQAEVARGNFAGARRAFRRALQENENDAAARRGLDLTNEVLALDPAAPRISARERERRENVLARRAAAALAECGVTVPPGQTAEDLWNERERSCGGRPTADRALALL
ncbi:MAG TPA: tetratricopeptide repeat protein, partial [Bryobacteraceae bacterium]|nr:tetratricopeptide repeat protein [Bryobacteraceae bacterium]